ncbi:unnamed protein product [Effrenium voratum]|nr:unnamed protein product [Effrenium voratum]
MGRGIRKLHNMVSCPGADGKVAMFLLNKHIPEEVRSQPQQLADFLTAQVLASGLFGRVLEGSQRENLRSRFHSIAMSDSLAIPRAPLALALLALVSRIRGAPSRACEPRVFWAMTPEHSKSFNELAADKVAEFQKYIEATPHEINRLCFAGGLAIVITGIFGVIDIFDVFEEPIYYVVNAYMVFFGAVTVVTESHPSFASQLHETLLPLQKWMHEWAKGLTMLWGRGLFYLFQGTLCMLSASLLSLGLLIGVYMMVMGLVCLQIHYKRSKTLEPEYIRITE